MTKIDQGAAASRERARLNLYLLNILCDLLVLLSAFALANVLMLGAVMGEPGKPHGLIMFAMVAPVYALLAINGSVYGIRMLDDIRGASLHALWALTQAAMLTLLIVYLGKIAEQLSRLTFASGFLLSAAGLVAVRFVVRQMARPLLGELSNINAMIVDGVEIERPAGALYLDATQAGLDPMRWDAAMAERLASAVGGAERVVVACPADRVEPWSLALKSLSARGEIVLPGLQHFVPAKVAAFDDHATIIVAGGPMQFRERIIKRLLDLVVAAAAVILLSPILIGAALAVRLTSPGPVLFRQQRIGRDARPFGIYKFRTMRHEASDHKAEKLTQRDDDRITPVGAFLRRTSIDELPQLFNVLAGDMSIVGPRPHAAAARAADQLYWEVDPRYWERHCIKPGMTGLAQVRGHRGATDREEDLINRLQSDLEYVTDWSVWRDLRIIFATLRVLSHHNAY